MPSRDELRTVVQRMIDAGEPEAAIASVIKSYGPVEPMAAHAQPEPSEPSMLDKAADWLPTIGGGIGGLVGGIPGAAAGGAAGEGFKQLATKAGEIPGAVADVARNLLTQPEATMRGAVEGMTQGAKAAGTQGATQAAAEGGGRVVGAGLRTMGRGFARAGALPLVEQTSKYGPIGKLIVENRTPVTKAGLEKAGRLKTVAQGAKSDALEQAQLHGLRGGQHVPEFVTDALGKAEPYAEKARRAGMPDPSPDFAARGNAIVKANPEIISLKAADEIKGTLDDTLGPAYKKLRAREGVSPDERINLELSQAISRAQEAAVPNYRGLNKDIMDKSGLERVIRRRLTGANQGLENLATAVMGPAAIPARIALMPGVASTAGIGTHMAGEHPAVFSNAIRAALMALMASHEQEP